MSRPCTITHQQAFGQQPVLPGSLAAAWREQLLAWRVMRLQEARPSGAAPDRTVLLSLGAGLVLLVGLFMLMPVQTLGM